MFRKIDLVLSKLPKASSLTLAFVILLAGCAPQTTDPTLDGAVGAHVLQPGDIIELSVDAKPEFGGTYLVGQNGYVKHQLLGHLPLAEASIRSANRIFRNELSSYTDQDINTKVRLMNPGPIYVLGEVEAAGEYPYVEGLTIDEVVSIAGGYTYRADHLRVFVTRREGQADIEVDDFGSFALVPGDVVRIPQRYY